MSPSTDTRERILATARSLFSARSYADVGVAEICSDAGVRKSSFYHFFPSKRDLSLAVMDDTFADFKSDVLNKAFAPDLPPMQRLRTLVDMTAAMQADMHERIGMVPGCPFGNLGAEQSTQDDVLRRKIEQLFKRMTEELAATVQLAVEQGEIGDVDVPATADAMLAFMEGVLLLGKTRNDPQLIARLLPNTLDIRVTAKPGG